MELFFGKKKIIENKPTTLDAINGLKNTLHLLDIREANISKQIESLQLEAKNFIKNRQKDKALNNLKRKKMLETERESLFGTRLNVDTQRMILENVNFNSEIFKNLKIANTVLEKTKVDINEVEQVTDDLQDNISIVQEVSELLSKPIGPIYDDDLLIQELKSEIEQEEMNTIHNTINKLPKVPTHVPATNQTESEIEQLKTILG